MIQFIYGHEFDRSWRESILHAFSQNIRKKNARRTFDQFDNMNADNKSPGNIEVFIYNKEMFRAM